jgi:hypothetical protein
VCFRGHFVSPEVSFTVCRFNLRRRCYGQLLLSSSSWFAVRYTSFFGVWLIVNMYAADPPLWYHVI